MPRIYPQDHKEIPFFFRQSVEDFIVTERMPVFRQKGNFLICLVEKKGLTTFEMLRVIEEHTQCQNIGYAGLKDKYATTTQYLSLPFSYYKSIEKFSHPKIKIVKTFKSDNKIQLGDLEGNHFFIRLKQVTVKASESLKEVIEDIRRHGMPNYFGFQRFSTEKDHFEKCREIAYGEVFMKDKKMQRLLTSSYQSYLFNDWLESRITLSKEIASLDSDTLNKKYGFSSELIATLKEQPVFFKVLPGDIVQDQSTLKWHNVSNLKEIRKPLKEHKLLPTGLIAGKQAWRSRDEALVFEEKFDDLAVDAKGERRLAWIYPKEIRYEFKEKEAFFELSFFLPKGSYATVLLENVGNRLLG